MQKSYVNFLFIHRESVHPGPPPSCLDRMNMRSLMRAKKRKEEKKNQYGELLRFAGSSAGLPQLRRNCKRPQAAWLFGAARIQKKELLRRLVPTTRSMLRCLQSSMLPFWPHTTSVQLKVGCMDCSITGSNTEQNTGPVFGPVLLPVMEQRSELNS